MKHLKINLPLPTAQFFAELAGLAYPLKLRVKNLRAFRTKFGHARTRVYGFEPLQEQNLVISSPIELLKAVEAANSLFVPVGEPPIFELEILDAVPAEIVFDGNFTLDSAFPIDALNLGLQLKKELTALANSASVDAFIALALVAYPDLKETQAIERLLSVFRATAHQIICATAISEAGSKRRRIENSIKFEVVERARNQLQWKLSRLNHDFANLEADYYAKRAAMVVAKLNDSDIDAVLPKPNHGAALAEIAEVKVRLADLDVYQADLSRNPAPVWLVDGGL